MNRAPALPPQNVNDMDDEGVEIDGGDALDNDNSVEGAGGGDGGDAPDEAEDDSDEGGEGNGAPGPEDDSDEGGKGPASEPGH